MPADPVQAGNDDDFDADDAEKDAGQSIVA